MMWSALRCLKSYFYPSRTWRVKSISQCLSRYSRIMQTESFPYSSICILNDSLAFLSDPQLAKFLYLRNFDSKVCVPLICLGFSSGQGQWVYMDACEKNNMYHWHMSLFNISIGNKFKTPINSSSVFVDHL